MSAHSGLTRSDWSCDNFVGLHKYSETVYRACCESFNALPIAALLDGKFFCVHGGISPHLVHLTDIDKVCSDMVFS